MFAANTLREESMALKISAFTLSAFRRTVDGRGVGLEYEHIPIGTDHRRESHPEFFASTRTANPAIDDDGSSCGTSMAINLYYREERLAASILPAMPEDEERAEWSYGALTEVERPVLKARFTARCGRTSAKAAWPMRASARLARTATGCSMPGGAPAHIARRAFHGGRPQRRHIPAWARRRGSDLAA